ncbi:MAG TPA: gliding motility-associated C-terminal domain-containing protein [Flavobacteriales bacterium]|nr:gliding motility-associated C-terminal domain-containing protein [Flavobacteriales bacterium]HRP80611.1 gliding motility-associated C-terminal domain-containing protein [Flavobacteriales bacterium]
MKHCSTYQGGALALAILLAALGQAQPTCSIQLGPDVTICQGTSATLSGPPGYTNYLWSNGATTQNITVSTAGDYWCQVTYPSGNLVYNGDFSLGNTGFSSQFIYSLVSVQNEGYYTVGPNASWYHNQFQGTGLGNFLIGNSGYTSWANNVVDAWCQTISCCPGQTYTLSFWGRTLTNELPARMVWVMDGVLANWPDLTFPSYGAGWQPYSVNWTAGPGQTSVNACIQITSADGIGDDFGIDDINISANVILRDTVHVAVTPLPAVNLGPDTSLCDGSVLNLDATVPGATYQWQDGSSAPSLQVTQAGSYSVNVTALGCSNSGQVDVAFNPLPQVDLGNDTALCNGTTLSIDAFCPGCTYLWQDGSTAPTFLVSQPGTYWVDVTANNCRASDTLHVAYKPVPSVFLGNDTAICTGESLLLDATTPGATYQWQDASTGSTFAATSAGSYQVTVDLNGCTAQDAVVVSVDPMPTVDLGGDQIVCPGTVATFDASTPGATYLWNNGTSGPTLTSDQPGTYSVDVTVASCTVAASATLTNFTLQSVDLGPDLSVCAGASVAIGTTVPGATYLWSTGAATDSISVGITGTYWLQTTLNGCVVSDTLEVSSIPIPAVSLGPDLMVCPGGVAVLDATLPGASYLWSNGATTSAITVGGGDWSVEVTVAGCSASDQVHIGEHPLPTVNLGADTVLCPGQSMVLDAFQPGATYAWSTGSTSPSITVSSALQVSLTLTDANGCTASDGINVAVATPGIVNLGPDALLCTGSTMLLDASTAGASAYLWSTGATSPAIQAAVQGTYSVEVSMGPCTTSDTVLLTATPTPQVDLGHDTTLCPGEILFLQPAVPNVTFVWQDGSQNNGYTVSVPGQYSVIATTSEGCAASDTVQVAYLSAQGFDLGPDTTICSGSTILLDAGIPGGITQWSGAYQGSAPWIEVGSTGTYMAATTVAGCSFSDSVHVAVSPAPLVNLGPDTSFCTGSPLLLSAQGSGLLWDDGSTSNTRSITTGGMYWAQSTQNGCTTTDSILVEEIPLPQIQLGPDTNLCASGQLEVDVAVPGGIYLWNDGNTSPLRYLMPGQWQVTVSADGCASDDMIIIGELPEPLLPLPGDTTLCAGTTWNINVEQPNSTYLWSTGSTAPSLLVDGPGSISITVNRQGCTASADVTVAYVDLGSFSLGQDTTLCPGQVWPINIDMPGAAVLWNDGSTAPQRVISEAGSYQATISLGGCTAQSSVEVTYVELPAVDLGPDLWPCEGEMVLLSLNPGSAQITWSNGATGGELPVTSSGTYAATLALDGCSTSDAVQVTFLPVFNQLDLGPDTVVCPGRPITLAALAPSGASCTWSDGSIGPVLGVNMPGTYFVSATGPCILAADTITVHEGQCSALVHLPNAFTPDGDGINDVFSAIVSDPVGQWALQIFNRWGEVVFTSNDPAAGWDGTSHGQQAPVAVYVWDLRYRGTTSMGVQQVHRQGSVTLVR